LTYIACIALINPQAYTVISNPVTENNYEEFISTTEAASMLGISLRSVQYWVEKGKLDAWKTAGGHRRIVRKSVEKLMAEQDSARTRSTIGTIKKHRYRRG